MVLRMTNRWQEPALLCVSENDPWARSLVGFRKGISDFLEIMAAEVPEQVIKLRVVPPAEKLFHFFWIAAFAGEPLAQPFRRQPKQSLVSLVRKVINTLVEQFAIGLLKRGLEPF